MSYLKLLTTKIFRYRSFITLRNEKFEGFNHRLALFRHLFIDIYCLVDGSVTLVLSLNYIMMIVRYPLGEMARIQK